MEESEGMGHGGNPPKKQPRRPKGGILTTAGKLLFTGDSGNLVAFEPSTGKILWHQQLMSALSNGPSSYMLDGKQYLIVGAGDCLYAFTLAGKR